MKTNPLENMKKRSPRTRFFWCYTLGFLLCAAGCYCWFLIKGKSLIVDSDGWRQHFAAFVYLGQYGREVARTLLTTAQQARAALQPAQQVRGTLRVALADSLCSAFLPGLLQRYHALCPQVELVLCTATSDEMLQWLGTNQVDLAYTLDEPLVQPNLVLALDVPEAICFVAPAGHPLAAQKRVSLEELAHQEFLLTERGMSYRDALDQTFAAHQLAVNPYLELGSAALLCQMVERGMGLSFLPEYIVRDALAAGTLARLLVPDCTVTMRRQLFYHRDKWLTPQMKAFIELAQEKNR